MAVLNKFAKPTVLVTGATGAIGRAVCRDLVVNGYLVLGLIRNLEAKERLPYAVIPVLGDIRDPASWEHDVEQADILIHLALQPLPVSGPKERGTPSGRRTRSPESWTGWRPSAAGTRSS